MTTSTNGHHPSPPVTPSASSIDALVMRDTITDRAGALLDELDSFISELSDAMQDRQTARQVIADAETEQAIIEASITLGVEAKNAESRKALLVLALRVHAEYARLGEVVRHARASLWSADHRLAVVKERVRLARAALALLALPL